MYCAAKQGRQVVLILIYNLIDIFSQPNACGTVWIRFNLDVLLLKEAGNTGKKTKIWFTSTFYALEYA